jgi:hypothetical protein
VACIQVQAGVCATFFNIAISESFYVRLIEFWQFALRSFERSALLRPLVCCKALGHWIRMLEDASLRVNNAYVSRLRLRRGLHCVCRVGFFRV